MTASNLKTSSFGSRITDIVVLTVSFLVFTFMAEFENLASLLTDLVLYVAVFFVCLRVSKRIFFEYVHSSKRFVNILFGNVTGLLAGSMLIFIIYNIFPGMIENMMIVVFSSILAFFILGTLSPMVKSSHNDIIPH